MTKIMRCVRERRNWKRCVNKFNVTVERLFSRSRKRKTTTAGAAEVGLVQGLVSVTMRRPHEPNEEG